MIRVGRKVYSNNMLPNPRITYGSYDWTRRGYSDGIGPLIRHGFTGAIHDEDIHGKWFCDITQATHGDIGHTASSVRFRYLPYYKNGTIVWTDRDDAVERNIINVSAFINDRGWPLGGKLCEEVVVVDELILEKYGTQPKYSHGDIPNIPKRA